MKFCAACHTNLPKDSYSKKQWKLDEYQQRCKVCTSNNREVQPIPTKQHNNDPPGTKAIKYLDSKCMEYAGKKINDEELFKQPPPTEDCPICFLRMPILRPTGKKYMSCCGKEICSGCTYAPLYDNQGNKVDNKKCPYCRTPWPDTQEEFVKRIEKRVEAGDTEAMHNQGNYYRDGTDGYAQDYTKALELYHRAAELGYSAAYTSIGVAYNNGEGVEVDKKKAEHYFELAAVRGDVTARYNLAAINENAGKYNRAIKHYLIAVGAGDNEALKKTHELYSRGFATKEDYTKALRSYQEYLSEIKSRQRDEAVAATDYRYY